jgi:hypothetical protein
MRKLQKIHIRGFAIALALIAIAALISCCSGCSTSGRAYSPDERIAIGNALLGQSLDLATTSMALEDERVFEGNPLFWSDDDIEAVISGKLVFFGLGYLAGEVWPQHRKTIWWALGVTGYAGASWNTYQMIEHGTNPWE